MIVMSRGVTNTVYATCREKSLLTNPSYIIKFIADIKKLGDARYCVVTDSGAFPLRNQKFTIIETNTPTAITNQIKLDISRSWKYTIYECTAAYVATLTAWSQFSSTGLTVVETGRVKVLTTAAVLQTHTSNQTSFKEYNG